MNLSLVHELLVAADQQPHGFLQICGKQSDYEVRLMAAAGLVEATLSDGKGQLVTSINRLTDSGHSFLRAFTKTPIQTGLRPAQVPGPAGEWNLNP